MPADDALPSRARPWRASYPPSVDPDPKIAPRTVPQLFEEAAARHGPLPALSFGPTTLSYAELARRVRQTAHALARAGIGPGEAVALYLPNLPWHPIFFYGALTAGARVAHLSPLDALRELEHKLRDSGARTLVTTNLPNMTALAEQLARSGAVDRVILCDAGAFGPLPVPLAPLPQDARFVGAEEFLAGAPDGPFASPAAPEDVALLQYTGGTTGLPKGAVLTHRNLTAAVSIYDAWYEGFGIAGDPDAPPQEVALVVLPLFHIYALVVLLLRQTQEGAHMVLALRFDPAEILDLIERRRVTLFPGVPTMWTALVNMPDIDKRDLSSLRLVGSGGAPLPLEVKKRFDQLTGLRLGGGWGMTETASAGTGHLRDIPPEKAASVGLPLPGLEMKVVDVADPARELPLGETGELAIRGPNITRGYWNRPDADVEAFHDGWLLTGDIGRIDREGYVWLVDRKKDMIISSGYNVYPQMIEQAIYEHPAVAECVVIGIPDDYRGESAKAFVALRPGAQPFALDELRAFLSDKLGRHELPAALEFRDHLPRTAVGKLSRKELRDELRGAGG
ncbi:AMP-binding protein [Oceanicella actignis]|uniref:AMP-binding protein n=1 Tax=Oceanicella actignis TaxID=1189325 RepID=UPI0011E723A6|nr:AMP-binding protein [Oceanicella actignis]TYO91244.1 long-chain acyl-CoA synthetase [Oceanicella actignis]